MPSDHNHSDVPCANLECDTLVQPSVADRHDGHCDDCHAARYCGHGNERGACAACAATIAAAELALVTAQGFPLDAGGVASPMTMRVSAALLAERGTVVACVYTAERGGPCGRCIACDDARNTAAGIVFARRRLTPSASATQWAKRYGMLALGGARS